MGPKETEESAEKKTVCNNIQQKWRVNVFIEIKLSAK